MTNSKREYNEFIRANLPYGITYDSARYQYVTFNGKRFVTYLEAKWYIDYLTKFGGGPEDDIRNDLFGTSEEGVWFEANDSTTLFTDVAGTTPVTTPGDAVALQLDKSQGLTLGPELFTDATVGGGAVEVDGQFVFDAPNEVLTVFDSAALVANRTFIFSFNVVSGSGLIRFYAGNKFKEIDTSSGSGTVLVVSDGASDRLQVRSNTFVGTIDLPSVKELPGNHRTQATTAARPLYALHPVGGVRNLLEYTEDSDFWAGATYTKNATSDPFDGNGGVLAECDASGAGARVTISNTLSLPEGETYTFSIWVKAGPSGVANFRLYFREQQGNFTIYELGPATNSSDVWTRYEISGVKEADGSLATVYLQNTEGSAADFYVFGPQLEEGSTATNYQRVGSFLDVSEEGKARRGRIWYNGTSHFMETGTITPGTDKVQVFAGVRKLRNNAQEAVLELNNFAEGGLSVQTLTTFAPWRFGSRGDAAPSIADAASSTFPSPVSSIITGLGDISGDSAILRVDGVEIAESTADQGLGNYANSVLRFGARGGTSLFYNGYEDTSIVRFGPNLDDTTISKVESYVASKTPASELLIPAGPELVTNGTFDTDSDWTKESGWTISGGTASLDASVSGAGVITRLQQDITTVAGKTYVISADFSNVVNATSNEIILQAPTGDNTDVVSDGSYNVTFIATSTTSTITIRTSGAIDGDETAEVDNVSVREFIPK